MITWMNYNIRLKPDEEIRAETIQIGRRKALVIRPKASVANAPGVLWIHGGGYITGMKEMVYMSRAVDLVKKFGAVVVAPEYRLALQAPYPAARNENEYEGDGLP